jgi:hypothetical protein
MSFTKLDYCQYLLSSQVNYTLTNLAEHLASFSHDTINRYLKGEKLVPRMLFEQVESLLEPDPEAYSIFDDTVLDKSFGPSIEVVRKQWSGNKKGVISGIGVVSCVYVNPQTEYFWVVDYRIFDPDTDGKRQARSCRGDAAWRRASAAAVSGGAYGHLVRHEGPNDVHRRDEKDVLLPVEEQPPSRRQRR